VRLNYFFHLLITCLCAFCLTAFSQDVILNGQVRDATTNETLIGVNVKLNDSTGTTTDHTGKYNLKLSPGNHAITFSFIGYTSQTKQVNAIAGQPLILNISLQVSTTNLGTVVVSAGRFEQKIEDVTVSMAVIKSSLLENTNTTAVEDVMDQVPGVTVIDGQPNIRGGSGFSYGAGSRVLLLVDDLPMLTADAGDPKWSFLPIENIEQIEVIKGASSALYGSSALNGVINVRTAFPKSTPITSITMYTGLFDAPKRKELKWWGNATQMTSGVNVSHSERSGQFDIVTGASLFKDDGYRVEETEERYRFNLNLRYRFKKIAGLSIGANFNTQQAKGASFFIWANDSSGAYTPMGGLDSGTTISYYTTSRTNIDPYLTYAGSHGNIHKIRTRYFESNNRNNTQQQSLARLYFAEYLFQKKFNDNFTWTLGADEMYSKVVSELYGNKQSNNISFFTQSDYQVNRLLISFGARWENNRVDTVKSEFRPVFRAGLNYKIFSNTHFRLSYGQGIRYPTIAEKFVKTQVGNIVIYSNDSLQPESGWSAEAGLNQGIKIGEWKGQIDAAAFWTEYQNMMEFTFAQYGNPIHDPYFGFGFKSLNIGNTRIKGIDLTLTGDGNLGHMPLEIIAGYTYIDPKQIDYVEKIDTGRNSANYNVLKYRFRHMAKADVQATVMKHVDFGMSMRYYSFMESIDKVFEKQIPGVEHYRDHHHYGDWIFDARISYRFSNELKVALIVKNLFNHEYMGRPADMQPPRSFAFQVNLKM
jgi:outer membrane cobalamin receptor